MITVLKFGAGAVALPLAAFGGWLAYEYWLGTADDIYMGDPEDYLRPQFAGRDG